MPEHIEAGPPVGAFPMSTEPTPPAGSTDAVRARHDAATATVDALCAGRRWTMTVPADPSKDPDLVISAALADIPRLLAERDRLAAQVKAATRFEFSFLPEGHPERDGWTVTVEPSDRDRWIIRRAGGRRLSVDCDWDPTPHVDDRDDAWDAAHSFDLDTALSFAALAAKLMTYKGLTATDVLALDATQDGTP